MGRRKKEEPGYHRECIACAAEQLFFKNGITDTSMDDIAKAAGYSKATLYVYFKNKEEIIGALALKGMKLLHEKIGTAFSVFDTTKEQYQAICKELTAYQEDFPLYFDFTVGEINVDFDAPGALPIEREIFQVGEQITEEISVFLQKGIAEKVLREDILLPQTIFFFWASLSGTIKMAHEKQRYIEKSMGMKKQEFLDGCFDTLFRSICNQEGIAQ